MFPKATLVQLLSAAEVRRFHVTPLSLDVMTRFPVPDSATATKTLFPKATLDQRFSAAEVRMVHGIPDWWKYPNAHAEQIDDPAFGS